MYTTAAKGWKSEAKSRVDTRCQKAKPETKKFKLGQPARTVLLLILQILGDRS